MWMTGPGQTTRGLGVAIVGVLLGACGDRELVTGIGYTLAQTRAASAHASLDVSDPTYTVRIQNRLDPEYTHMQHFTTVTLEFDHEPIAQLREVLAAIGIGAGYVIELTGSWPTSSPPSDFVDVVQDLERRGWVATTGDPDLRSALDPGPWHCPPPKLLPDGHHGDLWLQMAHPSELLATFQVSCEYRPDKAPKLHALFTLRPDYRRRGTADPPYYQEPIGKRAWRDPPAAPAQP